MAITISQQPTYPNVTYTDLVYVVESTETAQPQFQYVMDIVSGSTLLSRVKQYPNPASAGVFNPARILNDYLEYPTQFTLGGVTLNHSQVEDFSIKFGEEYGTSISSSVTLYDGAGSPGAPSVTGTTATVFPGVIEPNNGVSYNWQDSGSLKRMSDRPDTIGVDLSYDDIYVTVYNGDSIAKNIRQRFYDENGTLVGTDLYSQAANTFATHKIGYSSIPANAAYFTLDLAGLQLYTYPIADTCHYERANFAFINDYGFWDMYGVNLPKKRNTTIERRELTKPFVDYSSATSAYDVTRRGKQIYNTSVTDRYSVSTQWLNQEEADWLSQMFESPEVYLQLTGGNATSNKWAPINITQTSWVHNTNTRSQKQFQYEIQYEFSNQRRGR